MTLFPWRMEGMASDWIYVGLLYFIFWQSLSTQGERFIELNVFVVVVGYCCCCYCCILLFMYCFIRYGIFIICLSTIRLLLFYMLYCIVKYLDLEIPYN